MLRCRSKGIEALVMLSLVAACQRETAAARFHCECGVLTDTDGLTTEQVEVCASSADRAREMATGCAQSAAPAAVQSCKCEPRPGSCQREACQPAADAR